MKINELSDELIYFGQSNAYFVPINFGIYLHKNWGVGLKVQMNFINENQGGIENFNRKLESRFGEDFFYDSKTISFASAESSETAYLSYFVGLNYRKEYKKFLIMPSFYYGITEIDLDSYSTKLKEKGGNEIISYSLVKNDFEGDNYVGLRTFQPGIQVGYPLCKFLFVQAHFRYTLIQSDFSFVERLDYQLSEKSIENKFVYNKNISSYQFGIGLLFKLEQVPSFKKKKQEQ